MNRRGNIFDGFGIIITVFIVGIAGLIGITFITGFANGIISTPNMPPVATSMTNNLSGNVGWVLDFFILMLFIAMPLTSMILAFFNNVHPFFFWSSIGVVMLLVILGGTFSDSWIQTINDPNLSAASAQLPMSNFIFSNYAIYAFFVVLIISGGIFIKAKNNGGGY